MTTMNVKDADGATIAIEKPLAPGRVAAASSRPVALSTEDKAALDALLTPLASILAKLILAPSTEAKQDVANTSLASVDTKLSTLHTDLATTLHGDLATTIANLLAAATPAGANLIGKVGIDQTTPGTTNGTTDNGFGPTSVWGVSNVPFTSADQHSAAASVTGAPTSGQKLVIDDLIFSVDTAMSVTFKEETSGTVMFGPFYLPANGSMQITPRGKRKLPVADKKLQVISSVAGNISVLAGYHSEP